MNHILDKYTICRTFTFELDNWVFDESGTHTGSVDPALETLMLESNAISIFI